MTRLGTAVLGLVCVCSTAAAKEDPYCAPLASALDAARAADGFVGVTGADAGLYHDTTLALPGAKLCATSPRERTAAWRCHMETNERYTLALDVHAELLGRIEACLGPEWTGERSQDQGYLRIDVYTRADDAARVQVLTTKGPKYRLFVVVLAAR